MFLLTENPIDTAALRDRLQRPEAGALVVFEGWVRNHHRGREVSRLEYEAFAEMAQTEGESLVAEIEESFPGVRIECVHRWGDLVPGDVAVWIGATSAHRDDAFRAGRLAIEEVKRRLPIWKKEHHPGMDPVWVNCTEENSPDENRTAYYARQTALPEVGQERQNRLRNVSALVVGVGGLGCPAALYLAGAGIGRITLVDGGKVELSNLHRQVLFETGDVGAPKATRAALALRARNPHIAIEPIAADLTPANVRALVTGRTVVLDCTDNFATRLLLHDACLEAGVPLVQAAVYRWEGVVNVFERGKGGCLYCTGLPRVPVELENIGNCDGAPVFGPAVGILGLIQATEAIKVLLGLSDAEVAAKETLLVDLLSTSITRIARPARVDCPHCGNTNLATGDSRDSDEQEPLVIDQEELARRGPFRMIALATEEERAGMDRLNGVDTLHPADIDAIETAVRASDQPVVLACPYGLRSAAVARTLRAAGVPKVFALAGGLPPPTDRGIA